MFHFEKRGRLGIISMDKLPANGYDIEFFHKFDQILKELEEDDEVSVVLLKSSIPKFFCAGADIKVFSKNSVEENNDMIAMANKVATTIAAGSNIYIAYLNGHALGGGLELSMACDIRIASDKEFLLGLPEINLGLIPGNGGVARMVHLVGQSRALELLITGNTFSSREAYEFGLITRIFPKDDADDSALNYASKLATGPRLAMRAVKQALSEGTGKSLEEFLQIEKSKVEALYDTFDAREGFQAFVDKRKPNFE